MIPTDNNKTYATGAVGAVVLILTWIFNTYVLPTEKPIPGEVVAALGMVLQTAATYFTPRTGDA